MSDGMDPKVMLGRARRAAAAARHAAKVEEIRTRDFGLQAVSVLTSDTNEGELTETPRFLDREYNLCSGSKAI